MDFFNRLLEAHRRDLTGHIAESVRVILRCEAKETLADARPQAWKNRRRIRWNTLRDRKSVV